MEENYKEKLLASYKKGWDKINELCNWETVQIMEQKEITFGGQTWVLYPGMSVLDVPDDTLAKWLYMSRKVSECKEVTGEDLIKIITDLGRE